MYELVSRLTMILLITLIACILMYTILQKAESITADVEEWKGVKKYNVENIITKNITFILL